MPARRTLRHRLLLALLFTPLLAACDLLGIEPASAQVARREADGRAIGAACRHAGRGLEDCYALNRKAEKAAIYAGWKEMSDYMRENQVADLAPTVSPAAPAATAATPQGAAPPTDERSPAAKR